MTIEAFKSVEEAAAALHDLLLSKDGRALPQEVQDLAWEMMRPGGSMAFAVLYFPELVFARKLEGPAVKIAAACALFNQGKDLRSFQLAQALQRRSGQKAPEGTKWPPATDDPPPLDHLLPNAEKVVSDT